MLAILIKHARGVLLSQKLDREKSWTCLQRFGLFCLFIFNLLFSFN